MLNLLTDPLLQVQRRGSSAPEFLTLPELLAALVADQIQDYPALPPHQEPLWHCFLVQLAALALESRPEADLPEEPEAWNPLLRRLTEDEYPNDEPWQLVGTDYTRPAFLQPPVPTPAEAADYKRAAPTPDGLDLTVTSKNHDVKQDFLRRHRPEHWIYALATLQTAGGFSGAGNYGVFRMNGGFSSRPFLSLAPAGGSPGRAFRRDLTALRARSQERTGSENALPTAPLNPGTGRQLLWTLPWGGRREETLPLEQIHPLAIEVCRRVRLEYDPIRQSIKQAWKATSAAARCQAWPGGAVGDPWTPISIADPENPKALTLPAGGFTARRLLRYCFSGSMQPPALAQPTAAEIAAAEPMTLTARGLTRGSGKTDGWSAQEIPLPAALLPAISQAPENAEIRAKGLAQAAALNAALDKAAAILAHAAIAYGSGSSGSAESSAGTGGSGSAGGSGRRGGGEAQRWATPVAQEFQAAVAPTLFPALARCVAARDESHAVALQEEWLLMEVLPALTQAWEQHHHRRPTPSLHNPERTAAAYALLQARLRGPQGFPQLYPSPAAPEAAAAAAEPKPETESEKEQTAAADPNAWPNPATPPEPEPEEEPLPPHLLPPHEQAVRIAQRLAHPRTDRRDLIRLAQMNPENPAEIEFWNLLQALDIRPAYGQRENWAALTQAIARMTPQQGRGQPQEPEGKWWPSAHNPQRSLGQALWEKPPAGAGREPAVAATRLQQLLSAQGPALRQQAAWIARHLAQSGQGVNCRQLARLLLPPHSNAPAPDPAFRANVVRDYHRAQRRAQRTAAGASPGAAAPTLA